MSKENEKMADELHSTVEEMEHALNWMEKYIDENFLDPKKEFPTVPKFLKDIEETPFQPILKIHIAFVAGKVMPKIIATRNFGQIEEAIISALKSIRNEKE